MQSATITNIVICTKNERDCHPEEVPCGTYQLRYVATLTVTEGCNSMTRTRAWLCNAVGFLVAIVLSTQVEAGPAGPSKSKGNPSFSAYWLALDLYSAGVDRSDPLMVITAATIYLQVRPDDRSPRIAVPEHATPLPNPLIDFQTMIAAARALAGESSSLQQIIVDLCTSGDRGRTPGIGRAVGYVAAGASESYSISYRGGEVAELTVRGDGSTDLELAVIDEYDHEICRQRGRGELRCSWTPVWTAQARVRVENHGGVGNQYHVLTN
jgi:hypothetical protein